MPYIFLFFILQHYFSRSGFLFVLIVSGVFQQLLTVFLPSLLPIFYTTDPECLFNTQVFKVLFLQNLLVYRLKFTLLSMVFKALLFQAPRIPFTLTYHINFFPDYEMYYKCGLISLFFYLCCLFNLNAFLPY